MKVTANVELNSRLAFRRFQTSQVPKRLSPRFMFLMPDNSRYTPAEAKRVLAGLEKVSRDISVVDKTLQERYGIDRHFDHVALFICKKIIEPQGLERNNAMFRVEPPSLDLILSDPARIGGFFRNASAIYAHEIGHLLYYSLPDGEFRPLYHNPIDGGETAAESDLRHLKKNGSVPFQYLQGVDFGLFHPSLTAMPWLWCNLHYFMTELVAFRVAERLVGRKRTRDCVSYINSERIKAFRTRGYRIENDDKVLIELYHYVLSKIYSLDDYASTFRGLLKSARRGHLMPWHLSITTEQLAEKMVKFYQGIDLKDQRGPNVPTFTG